MINQKKQIQGQIDQLELQLDVVKATIEKEAGEADNARDVGASGGAIVGGLIGRTRPAVALGSSVGGVGGVILEEMADAVTSEKTTFTLKREQSVLLNHILELKKQISDTVEPRIQEARAVAARAKKLYDGCRSQN